MTDQTTENTQHQGAQKLGHHRDAAKPRVLEHGQEIVASKAALDQEETQATVDQQKIDELDKRLEVKEVQSRKHKQEIQTLEKAISDRNAKIVKRKQDLNNLKTVVKSRDNQLRQKDQQINDLQRRINQMEQSTRSLTQADQQARSNNSQLQAANQELGQQANHMAKDLAGAEQDLANAAQVIQSLKANTTMLDSKVLQARHERSEILSELDEKNDECNQVRIRWQKAVAELAQLKSAEKPFAVDDESVRSKWRSLDYAIRKLSTQAFKSHGSRPSLPQDVTDDFLSISRNYAFYLSSKDHFSLLFRAAIWLHVSEGILCAPFHIWGNDVGNSFTVMSNAMKGKRHLVTLLDCQTLTVPSDCRDKTPNLETDYHAWRTATAKYLHQNHQVKQDVIDRMVEIICSRYGHLTTGHSHEGLEVALLSIGNAAVELALIFARSRANFFLVTHDQIKNGKTSCKDNAEYMDVVKDVFGDENIDLLVSPALIKRGDSDGDCYEQCTVLAKGSVCC
ncbi:hypothetical protein SUNI508_00016 [Seiridium unicorne]|uniref:Chromosome partition protein Smc n=1 Tax=Seiridium unicorne TaxID=138068 RepID=A0ABR2VI03_9PEZI